MSGYWNFSSYAPYKSRMQIRPQEILRDRSICTVSSDELWAVQHVDGVCIMETSQQWSPVLLSKNAKKNLHKQHEQRDLGGSSRMTDGKTSFSY